MINYYYQFKEMWNFKPYQYMQIIPLTGEINKSKLILTFLEVVMLLFAAPQMCWSDYANVNVRVLELFAHTSKIVNSHSDKSTSDKAFCTYCT